MELKQKQNQPIITVVIPTFKRPRLLERAVLSVQAQSIVPAKICVYDNASGDETREVIAGLAASDPRILYKENEKNIGKLANMINGIKEVQTPFYLLLSDDDFLLPGFFKAALEKFEKEPEIGFVCGKSVVLNTYNKEIVFRNENWKEGVYQPSPATVCRMYYDHFTSTAVLFRKEIKETIGEFDDSGNDNLYLTFAAAVTPFAVLDTYGGVLVVHEGSYSCGGGIRTESHQVLFHYYCCTMNKISSINIDNDLKVELFMLANSTYTRLLDDKQIEIMRHESGQEIGMFYIPEQITKSTICRKLSERFPPFARRFVLNSLLSAKSLIDIYRGARRKSNTKKMPNTLKIMLDQEPTDVWALFSSIKSILPSSLLNR